MRKINHIIKKIIPVSWYYLYLSLFRKTLSQFGQDIWVKGEVFNKKKGGYFVEIGSADGITFNNTFLLESKYKWKGICIEANPILFKSVLKYRKALCLNVCVDKDFGEIKFLLNWLNSGIISSDTDNKKDDDFDHSIIINAFTLESILFNNSAPSVIDYLSIDVEGAEERILAGFPFSKHTFNCITIERPSKLLRQILEKNGYIIIKEIPGIDVFYIHQSYMNSYTNNLHSYYQKKFFKV